jgi:hypothetical protein
MACYFIDGKPMAGGVMEKKGVILESCTTTRVELMALYRLTYLFLTATVVCRPTVDTSNAT